jgi:hypothetical protein
MEKTRERVPEHWVLVFEAADADSRRFLAQDGTITNQVEQAQQFDTEAEALENVAGKFEPHRVSEFLPPR